MHTIDVLFLLAPVAVVPLGLTILLRGESPVFRTESWRASWTIAAAAAAASFFLHQGVFSAIVAGGWFLFTAALLVASLGGLWPAVDLVSAVARFGALAYLSGGAVWLVMSRAGMTPLSFAEPIVLLTAVHFHFAGFAATVLAAAARDALAQRAGRAPLYVTVALVGALVAPAVTAAGFVFSRQLQLAGVALSAVSTALVSLAAWRAAPAIERRAARLLVRTSALSVPIAMALAVFYAVGELRGELWVSIPRMALWHGVLNAVGFSLCGTLGWTWQILAGAGEVQR